VLRALADALVLPGFEFTDMVGLRAGMEMKDVQARKGQPAATSGAGLEIVVTQAIYRVDGVTRRADALQAHPLNVGPRAVMNPVDAANVGITQGAIAKFATAVGTAALQVALDIGVAPGSMWIESGHGATAPLVASSKVEVSAA
jgi:NADH-quinone oxidoreductase subunit G